MSHSARAASDRNLLFGILALQMDFISRDALIQAMHAWVLEKTKPLGQLLVEQGAMAEDARALLEPLVEKHVRMHSDDPAKSLASVGSIGSARQALEQMADSDVQASLVHIPAAASMAADLWPTVTPSVGTPTSAGLRFRILRPHAEGGLGKVFIARDEELRRDVALKEIKDHHADDPDKRSRFLLEAEITGGLEHPGIVPVYGLGKYADGRPFYAMRFVRGDSMQDAIKRFHQADTPGRDAGERTLALRKLLGRFLDVCNATAYAHARGVLHRDLKPGNIMLGKYGETLVVDWGLAKPQGRAESASESMEGPLQPSSPSGSNPTQMGSAIGTPAYMPPEQAAGQLDKLGPASDVYSLGATLYSLLTGVPPFEGKEIGAVLRQVQHGAFRPPRLVKPMVPAALEAVCLKAMALKPEHRYASPHGLAEDIEHWLADEPVSAWPEPWQIRARRWVGRHRTLVTTAAATLLVATVSLTAATILLQEANYEKELAWQAAENNAAESDHQASRAAAEKRIAEMERENSATQQYFSLIHKVSASLLEPSPKLGWREKALKEVEEARGINTPSKSLPELRTLAVAVIAAPDLQELEPFKNENSVSRLAFSPDGRFLAIGQRKGAFFYFVKVIDLRTKKAKRITVPAGIPTGNFGILSLAFSDDGRLLAGGTREGKTYLWDVAGGPSKELFVLGNREAPVESVAFQPGNSKVLVSGLKNGIICLWDTATGKKLAQHRLFRMLSRIAFNPEGNLLACGNAERVQIIEMASLLRPADPISVRKEIPTSGKAICFSPDGLFLCALTEGSAALYELNSNRSPFLILKEPGQSAAHTEEISHVAFSPDGSLVLSGSNDGVIKIWEVATGSRLISIYAPSDGSLYSSFSPDGHLLAVTGSDQVRFYELRGFRERKMMAHHTLPIRSIAFSPEGKLLACYAWVKQSHREIRHCGSVTLWSVEDRKLRKCSTVEGPLEDEDRRTYLAFHPKDAVILHSGKTQREIHVWDYKTDKHHDLAEQPIETCLCFNREGTHFWAASYQNEVGQIICRSWPERKLFATWRNQSAKLLRGVSGITSLEAGRDWVVAGTRDGKALLFHAIKTDEPAFVWRSGGGAIQCVALSTDEQLAAFGTQDGLVQVYRVRDGESVIRLTGHNNSVEGVVFSPDGLRLVTASKDGTVHLYQRSGEAFTTFLTFRFPTGPVSFVSFSPDGTKLAVLIQNERAVRVWDLVLLREQLTTMRLDWYRGAKQQTSLER